MEKTWWNLKYYILFIENMRMYELYKLLQSFLTPKFCKLAAEIAVQVRGLCVACGHGQCVLGGLSSAVGPQQFPVIILLVISLPTVLIWVKNFIGAKAMCSKDSKTLDLSFPSIPSRAVAEAALNAAVHASRTCGQGSASQGECHVLRLKVNIWF